MQLKKINALRTDSPRFLFKTSTLICSNPFYYFKKWNNIHIESRHCAKGLTQFSLMCLMLCLFPLCSFRKSQAWVFVPESLGAQSVGGEYESLPPSLCQRHRWAIGVRLAVSLSLCGLFFFPQFNFFNCFASLFYIAFVMQDMVLLRQVGQVTSLRPFGSFAFCAFLSSFQFCSVFFLFAALLNCFFCCFLMIKTVVWGHYVCLN